MLRNLFNMLFPSSLQDRKWDAEAFFEDLERRARAMGLAKKYREDCLLKHGLYMGPEGIVTPYKAETRTGYLRRVGLIKEGEFYGQETETYD